MMVERTEVGIVHLAIWHLCVVDAPSASLRAHVTVGVRAIMMVARTEVDIVHPATWHIFAAGALFAVVSHQLLRQHQQMTGLLELLMAI